MTDRPTASSGSTVRCRPGNAEGDELEALRTQIDELDAQIVKMLNRRARLGLQAGHAKSKVADLSLTPSASARCSSESPWPTTVRCPDASWRSTAG